MVVSPWKRGGVAGWFPVAALFFFDTSPDLYAGNVDARGSR